ncbi:MAG: chorismate synthase [Marinilabiliales bacterium]|nr:MAG: chorismate synthase [Marinilabiliales bacterium]
MNSTGRIFRISLFGESHGQAIGVTIDGCPPGVPLSDGDFAGDLGRRRPGRAGTTPRVEDDLPEIVSGHFNGHTTGAPLTIMFRNKNIKPGDYDNLKRTPRPGHSDFVAWKRFGGFNDHRGGGHFSGRLTLCLVAAGVVAKKLLTGIDIDARLVSAGGDEDIDRAVKVAMEAGDSVGGIVECRAAGIPVGWGEPFFDSVESVIAHMAFAIPAIKGVEFGSGFAAASMRGSSHNDPIVDETGRTATNNAGGISGGLTNGNELVFRIAVKPTSSISVGQSTYSIESGKIEELKVKGRHDACIALRVPVVLEAITAVALADLKMLAQSRPPVKG